METQGVLGPVATGLLIILTVSTSCVHTIDSRERLAEWPCTDRLAIKWIRDPEDCSHYYICHYGQPLAMPACPYGQVWGNKARNCVPKTSRWNDCDLEKQNGTGKDDLNNLIMKEKAQNPKYRHISVSSTPETLVISLRPTDFVFNRPSTMNSSIQTSFAPRQNITISSTFSPIPTNATSSLKVTIPATRITLNDYGQNVPKSQNSVHSGQKWDKVDTHYEIVTSPFQPNRERKYYLYKKKNKTNVNKKIRKITTSRPFVSKETKPSKRPSAMPRTTQKTLMRISPELSTVPVTFTTGGAPRKLSTKSTRSPKTTPRTWRKQQGWRPSWTQKTYGASKPTIVTWQPTTTPTIRDPQTETTATHTTMTTTAKNQRQLITQAQTTLQTSIPTSMPNRSTERPSTRTSPTPATSIAPTQRTRLQTTTTSQMTMMTTSQEMNVTSEKDDRRVGTSTQGPFHWAIRPMQLRLPRGHLCRARPGQLVAHPNQCHWYYNCSIAALENHGGYLSALVEECRYPQLFDIATGRCREFINVQCGTRFEPVDPCEYQSLQCHGANCVPCHNRYGTCRGRDNGIYPFHVNRWTPTFVTCYQQRNIAQDDCQPPTSIFSPDTLDCVTLFDVPKDKGGLRPQCSFRDNGFYPDEQGRCGIFFECRNGAFVSYDECPLGTVFDPMTMRCQLLERSTPPCGEGQNPSCSDRHDGFHADPFGRCPYYFECRKNQFVRYLTCDFGSFDPLTQECVIATEVIPQPCGLLPNPCQGKQSGFHPDEESSCRHYVECSRQVMISKGTCPEGTVFSAISGRCDRPENAPEPCGMAPSCAGKEDGRYSALTRGCSFYFECRRQQFAGLKQCTVQDGGFFFNENTGQCDFPQNICPPCGYRWWGCKNNFNR